MKKIFGVMLAFCLMTSLMACGSPSDDDIKAVRNVSFEGTELTVTLGANKSTGYEWDYEIYGVCIEPSINRSFKITGSKGDATGEANIGFTGQSQGTAVIVFTTPNEWDGTGQGDGYTVNVTVAADGKIVSANGNEGAHAPEPVPELTPPKPTPSEPTSSEPTPSEPTSSEPTPSEPTSSEPTPSEPTSPEPTPPEPTPKTSLVIADLKEGTYTGTMQGGEFANNAETVFTTIQPAAATVTIKNGQISIFCDSVTSAYGMLNGVKTPQSPDGSLILSGTLPLQQSGDAVTAGGGLVSLGKGFVLNHTDMKFKNWELKERKGDNQYDCTVRIAMTKGVPVATIAVDLKTLTRTATVPLALVSGAENTGSKEPLSAPYAAMLKNGDYQYTYSLNYDGKPYTATIATYNGMICRKVVSNDGTYSQRVVTINGNAWKVDDLTGAVVDGGTENAETLPDYASTLTFVASKTLETGAIADAYDFEYAGQKSNLVFLFSPEGKLVALILTAGDNTSEMEISSFSSVGNDRTLFDTPK